MSESFPLKTVQRAGGSLAESLQSSDRRIFFQHKFVAIGEDFERVALFDTQGTTDLFGDHDPTEFVDSSNNAGSFHKNSSIYSYCVEWGGKIYTGKRAG